MVDGKGPRLEDFAGAWIVRREITGSESAVFAGDARFTPDAAGLAYTERGALRIGGRDLVAERRYHWRLAEGRIEVAFADGRPFHGFRPATRAEAQHDCPPDHYRVFYDFAAWPAWQTVWRVTGPRKALCLVTEYRRG